MMVISGKKEKILDFKFVYDILFFPPSPIKPFKQRRYCLNVILFLGTNSLSIFYLEKRGNIALHWKGGQASCYRSQPCLTSEGVSVDDTPSNSLQFLLEMWHCFLLESVPL